MSLERENLSDQLRAIFDSLRILLLDLDFEVGDLKIQVNALSEAQDRIWCDVEVLKHPDCESDITDPAMEE